MKKAKLGRFTRKYVTSDNTNMLLIIFILAVLFIKQYSSDKFDIYEFFDLSVLISLLLALLCKLLATGISRFIGWLCEDAVKLTEDYEGLNKKYTKEDLLVYKENKIPAIELAVAETGTTLDIIINHDNSKNRYQLPSQIADNSDWIMKAHDYSTIYNNLNLRVDDIAVEGNRVNLLYSLTTYFDSLITNRAMDYALENGKTIREIYEPGPFLRPLSESRFSNHLGFNGFIETADNKIIFVIRNSRVSIAKHTLATSIGASLKTGYCLNQEMTLTKSGLDKAIRKEVTEELTLVIPDTVDTNKCIFAFYRDLVEGGKPQFLIYYKFNDISSNGFKKQFMQEMKRRKEENKKKKDKKHTKMRTDGTKFVFLSLEELSNCEITAGKLVLSKKKSYKMMPSSIASIVFLLRYLSPSN